MPSYQSSGSINKAIVLLLQNGNTIQEVVEDTSLNSKTFIFSKSIDPSLKKWILQQEKISITNDADYMRCTAEDTADAILIPRNDTISLSLKSFCKSIKTKNVATAILLINIVLFAFGVSYIDFYLQERQVPFLFWEVINYVSANGIVELEVFLLLFMGGILALICPAPLLLNKFEQNQTISPLRNVAATFLMYLISGFCIALYICIYVTAPTLRHSCYIDFLLLAAFLLAPIAIFIWCFKILRTNIITIARFFLINVKFSFQVLVTALMVEDLMPAAIRGKLFEILLAIVVPSLFAILNVTPAFWVTKINETVWRRTAYGTLFFYGVIIMTFISWAQKEVDLISFLHLGNYNQSIAVDDQLLKYRSTIELLNYDPKQQNIYPWVVLQTDKILVMAKDKNSKQLFYFRKNPYALVSNIPFESRAGSKQK